MTTDVVTAPTVVTLLRPYRLQHPWIFSRLVAKPAARIPPGSVVEVRDPDGRFVGRGFYNGHARIGIRLLTTDESEPVGQAFVAGRIARAVAWRRQLGLFGRTTGMRLFNSEGDGLSGLVVDLFGDVLAIQFFSAGAFRLREQIKAELLAHVPGARVYWFAEERVQKQESFDCWEMESPPPVVINEQGVSFHVAVGSKHKTGFFADQRDNRRHLAEFCADARVADLCCHTGGFALYAKKLGGARQVIGVDLDDVEALATARANATLNEVAVEFQAADVFTWLRDAHQRGDRFDVVILDPAKQTRNADRLQEALDQYASMNRLAMQVVKPGGVLLTCSCSGLIPEEAFLDAVRRGAAGAGREAQVFRMSGAAEDHPFMAHAPEGRYLKAIWCRVL